MDFYAYFQSHNNYFWEWEDDANIVAISNGKTIAYRAYIFEVIGSLTEQGAPPFGALLLALIATNRDATKNIEYIKYSLSNFLSKNFHFDVDKEKSFTDAFAFLELLARLPDMYKKGDKRLILFQTLFADCHNKISGVKVRSIKNYPNNNTIITDKLFSNQSFSTKVYFGDFRAIALLWRNFPNENMLLETLAGIPEMQENIEIIEEPIEEIENIKKDFTQQLIDNQATFEIGRLIKPLWAGFKIPINQTFQSEQPLGGVSDLSNKGDFDKLLISEFANDDLVFLSRLANREALFLHREIPPAHDQTQRVLLLDISLKNWGTPKTLAYATALSIAKHPKNNTNTQIFTVGKGFKSVEFGDIHQIIEAVQQTEGSLDASAGIEMFLKQYTHVQKMELFLVTSPHSLKMPKMQLILSEYRTYFKYIVTVDHEGNIIFYRNQHSGRHLLQKIQLPLAELWKKDAKKAIDAVKEDPKNYLLDLPLLLPTSLHAQTIMTLHDSIFCIDKDYNLLINSNEKKGWILLLSNVPKFLIAQIGVLKNGHSILCLLQEHQVIMINLYTKEQKVNRSTVYAKHNHYNYLYYHDTNECFCYLRKGGELWTINWHTNKMEEMTKSNYSNHLKHIYVAQKNQVSPTLLFKNDYLKNVKRIYINTSNQIVFNNHAIDLNVQGVIKWKQVKMHNILIISTFDNDSGFFHFKDGSCIQVSELGVSRWASPLADIPTLYVPMVVERSLGVATEWGYFAGHNFYQREDTVTDNQKAIGTKVFYKQFIELFINNIINGVTN